MLAPGQRALVPTGLRMAISPDFEVQIRPRSGLALRDGVIAPTIGYQEPDPECALDVVPNEAREAKVDAILSNAFAFGGLNAVIALRKA